MDIDNVTKFYWNIKQNKINDTPNGAQATLF